MASAKKLLVPALALAAGIALTACAPSDDKYKPQPPMPGSDSGEAEFSVVNAQFPYPGDPWFFSGTTDGTLNIANLPWRQAYMRTALNSLDGWSPAADITTGFSLPLDPASIDGSSVVMIKLWLNPNNKGPATDPAYLPAGATSPVAGVLTYGVDYTADVSPDTTSNGRQLRITPLKPLDFSRGPAANGAGPNAGKILNVGYLVVLTNGLKATDGTVMGPSTYYQQVKDAPADCSTFSLASEKGICQFTKGGLSIVTALQPLLGIDPASVIMSWSFSTQSIDDTLAYISATTTPQQTLIVPTGQTTAAINPAFSGKADIFVGSTVLPYYLTPPASANDYNAIMKGFWTAAAAPPAPLVTPTGQPDYLTMFNPVPKKMSDVTVPIIVAIPKIGVSACPGKPANGWPVAIVQHGLTSNRVASLTMAEMFADACHIVVSMDLPLHGINEGEPTFGPFYCNPTLPQCIGATERTFEIDIQNNDTAAFVPDGKPDPSGGKNATIFLLNLSNPLTVRDNLRQAEADFMQLFKSVPGLSIAPGTPLPAGPVGVDPTRISFVGLSMGAIVGGGHAHFVNDIHTVSLSVPGGLAAKGLLESETFGPAIRGQIAATGADPDSYLAQLTFRDLQAVVDSGDPINHIADAAATHPLFLMKVLGDPVVSNESTDRLITAAGLRKLVDLTPGSNFLSPGAGGYTVFKEGLSHGTLMDFANVSATLEMQAQVVGFAASATDEGGYVNLGQVDASVLDLPED